VKREKTGFIHLNSEEITPPPLKGRGGEGDLLSFVAPKPFGVEGSFRWQLKDNYRLNMKPPKKIRPRPPGGRHKSE